MASKVLLVEDDNNLREIYEARLQAEGYEIISAKDGEEALVVAKAQRPDLIISDVMMPKISGFEMLDILRNTEGLNHIRVIMLTALGQSEDKLRANSLGADRYLVKSQVTLEDIVKTAHELLDDNTAPTAPESPPTAAEDPASTPVPTPTAVPEPTATPAPTSPVADTPAATQTPTEPTTPPASPTNDTAQAIAPATFTTIPAPAAPASATPPATAPATDNTTPADPALSGAASTADEQAEMQAQIEQFIEQPSGDSPAPTADENNNAVMDEALKNLSGSEPAANTAPEPTPTPTPAPTATSTEVKPEPTATSDSGSLGDTKVVIANKKTIEPLDSVSKPDINELLAAEEAKNIMQPAPEAPTTAPASEATTPVASTAPVPKGPAPTVKSDGPDPNDIAL